MGKKNERSVCIFAMYMTFYVFGQIFNYIF